MHDGSNIADFSAYRVGRKLRQLDTALRDAAIAEMEASTEALKEATLTGDWFKINAAADRCDAARLTLLGMLTHD